LTKLDHNPFYSFLCILLTKPLKNYDYSLQHLLSSMFHSLANKFSIDSILVENQEWSFIFHSL
jgi:hypothetical protein